MKQPTTHLRQWGIALLLFLIQTTVCAQEIKDHPPQKKQGWNYVGVHPEFVYSSFLSGVLTPHLSLGNQRHSISLAPRIWLINPNKSLSWKRGGVQARYVVYPNFFKNRFNLFFFSQIGYNYLKSTENKSIYLFPNDYPSVYTQKTHSLDAYVGYGFEIMIFKGLFAETNMGVGGGMIRRAYITEVPTFPSANSTTSNEWQLQPGGMISLGLGYKLDLLPFQKHRK